MTTCKIVLLLSKHTLAVPLEFLSCLVASCHYLVNNKILFSILLQGCACPGVECGESCAECFIKSKANVGGSVSPFNFLMQSFYKGSCMLFMCFWLCD